MSDVEDFEDWLEWNRIRREAAEVPLIRWGKAKEGMHSAKKGVWHLTLSMGPPFVSQCGWTLVSARAGVPPFRICGRCRSSRAFEDVWG